MGKKDPRIDAYIAKAQPFAQPVLKHLRKLVHTACPGVEEKIKWGMPFFDYKGSFCNMAAFKQHCAFGFWKPKLLKDPGNYLGERKARGGEAMGNLGRITSLEDLPSDKIILDFIKQAKKLNDEGIKLPAKPKTEKKELVIPDELTNALKKNKKASKTFEDFSYTNKKEYAEWIADAKTEETRNKRLETAIEWMAEGKIRHWKYVKR